MSIRRILGIVVVLLFLLSSSTVALAQERTHVVQPGETLFSIARRYGLTVEQLAFANGITNPSLIYAGQVLIIPGGESSAAPPGGQTYTVVRGDTLFSIARRFGTTVDELVRLNNLGNANVLYVGQVLRISAGEEVPATTTPAPTEEVEATPASEEVTGPLIHVVAPGETLSQIALRYGTTYQALALLNGLENPNLIYAGQRLIIRQGEESTATPTATPEATSSEEAEPTATTPPTGTPTATPQPTATAMPRPTSTPIPTPVPTSSGIPTPTPRVAGTVPADAPNLLVNPGFEGSTRPVLFGEINVFEGWQPFYCDEPYTSSKCPAPRQGSGNPEGLTMGRPEFKSTDIPNRVHGGQTAQQWFCFFRSCRAGVYQTIETTPGALCEAGAYVQSWSAASWLGSNGPYTSDIATQDDRDNSLWFIRVDLSGGDFAFDDGVLISRAFGYADGTYDQYALIRYTFTATGRQTTVFFENLRLWPLAHNDSYIDDAYVRCVNP